MSQYIVPPDTSAKEKIVGGVLDGHQLVWTIIGIGSYALISLGLYRFLGKFSFILGFPILPVAGVFAFYKKHELSMFDYLRRRRKHRRMVHLLPNLRLDGLEDASKKDLTK